MSDFLKEILEIEDEEDVFLNAGKWSQLTEEETDAYIETVFKYYREKGFPYYPTNKLYRLKRFKALMGMDDSKVIKGKIVTQQLHGLSLCWTYMPHSWGVKCGGAKYTPLEVFEDDDHFRAVIRKVMTLGYSSMGAASIRGMVRIYRGAQSVSNFRPTSASALYKYFCNPGDTVLDSSSGYGGRLMGAIKAKVNYIGYDPCTPSWNGLQEMIKDWGNPGNTYTIHHGGSEDMDLPENSVDFAFTSPPYFNTEKYSDEETQSWKKYPTREEWLNGFLKDTIRNVHHALKPGKLMGINIAKVKSYKTIEEDCIRVAEECGFVLVDTWKYAMSNLMWTLPNKDRATSTEPYSKFEPIFWFRKKSGNDDDGGLIKKVDLDGDNAIDVQTFDFFDQPTPKPEPEVFDFFEGDSESKSEAQPETKSELPVSPVVQPELEPDVELKDKPDSEII